ncbi:DNA-directed RNA polymerase subunit beta [Thalassobacillus pellis]|uniref:DNA-directed RNA polymerase subunit beta n=1 Tax=Thalassobacillus pellis TaxID=748008 RepID=UPI0019611050|nr:DNA-directed RNA polymerase subunit beta [Thalassobacillus pellis]MBM7551736.1 lipopolysaccharide/colanic/teichoic acid biosynthesis glycosyltransferase [Thalassobacillus pellis]
MPTLEKNKPTRKQNKQKTIEQKGHEPANKEPKADRKDKQSRKERKPVRRILPIWLRVIIVLVLCVVALLVGLIVGYGVIGNGEPLDVLDISTWERIWNIAFKTE